MVQTFNLYIDDSGTRNTNRKAGVLPSHGYDWFALGGVLVRDSDEDAARSLHCQFMNSWNLDNKTSPLHSADIRNKTNKFTWLAGLSESDLQQFHSDLADLITKSPIIGLACVIDRPGYDARYRAKYGRDQWSLCKTAFSVLAERASKFSLNAGFKLRVYVEKSDRIVDGWIRGYYGHLRETGMPFSTDSMQKYDPLDNSSLKSILYDLKFKSKSSPMMQMADLLLWPMAIGGYHKSNRAYSHLIQHNKLMDCHLASHQIPQLGIKYSCWEGIKVKP